jgi:glutamate racemase
VIGVFDSGFGGLSVLRHLRRVLPARDWTYLGDSGRAPYGGRSVDTILDFSEQAVERLFDEGCRVVVVACNTVSCVALRHLQQRYAGTGSGRRVLGVTIPGAEAAVAAGPGTIGVVATARTVASGTYVTELHKLEPTRVVRQLAAPLLAPIVEEGWEDTDLARGAVRRYLDALGPVDVLLLGCTHYPLLRPVFDALVPGTTRVVDPAPWLAEGLSRWLDLHPGFDTAGAGALHVLCTGDPAVFARHGARFLGESLPPVHHVAEVGGRLERRDPSTAPVGQFVRSARAVRPPD